MPKVPPEQPVKAGQEQAEESDTPEVSRMPVEVHEMTLSPDGSGAARARDLTRWLLESRPAGRTTARRDSDVVLAVSELVGNAFNHTSGPVHVRLRVSDCGLLAEVHDSTDRPARLRRPQTDGSGGYGLHIVDALADRWGSEPTGVGKAVWALFGWQPA